MSEQPQEPKKPRKQRPKCDPVVLRWTKITGYQGEKDTACATCPQALWQIEESKQTEPSSEGPLLLLSVYCKTMHAFIERRLLACSGNP